MTTYVHRSIIVTAAQAPLARYVAAQLGPSSQGMFTAALRPIDSKTTEPTHFISAGLMEPAFADLLANAEALVGGAAAMGVEVPFTLAEALLAAADVSLEHGLVACARLGLELFDVSAG